MSRLVTALLTFAVLLAAAPAAHAYTLGPADLLNGSGYGACGAGLLATTAGADVGAPTSGTISQWSVRSGTADLQLTVLRQAGTTWVPVAQSPVRQQTGSGVATFAEPGGVAIHAGDILGVSKLTPGPGCITGRVTVRDSGWITSFGLGLTPELGAPVAFPNSVDDVIVLVNAEITPLETTHLEITRTTGGPVVAGDTIPVKVRALKADGTVDTDFRRTVRFTSSDPLSGLPADYTFTAADAGEKTFSVTLKRSGDRTITATDTQDALINGTSAAIDVDPATASELRLSAPANATAGDPVNVTVTAYDVYGNGATGYAGTVHFTSTDGAAVLPADATLLNGQRTFSATFRTAGSRTITATDTMTPALTRTSAPIAVTPGPVTDLRITGAPGTADAGDPFDLTVSARDAFGNLITGYDGMVSFSSSDAQAVLPADMALTGGAGVFSATLRTAGSRTITVGDGTRTGTTPSIEVAPGAATKLRVVAPPTATAGAAFDVTVSALDAFDNVATGSTAIVTLASGPAAGTLPGPTALVAGTRTVSVTLERAGDATLTADAPGLAAGSDTVTVGPGVPAELRLTAPPSATAGTPFDVTVSARDGYGNVIPGFAGTVAITSSDPDAVLPPAVTLTGGTGTFRVELRSAGRHTVTASDGSLTTTSGPIAVAPGAATRFVVDATPPWALFGIPFGFTVTALDAAGNRATGYGGTVRFGSGAGHVLLPADTTLAGGRGTFSATMLVYGPQRITVTDTANPAITGTSPAVPIYEPFVPSAGPPLPPAPTPTPTPSSAPSSDAGDPHAPSGAPSAACRRVPSLTGYTFRRARRILRRDGCAAVRVVRVGPRKRGGRRTVVRSQTPAAGTQPGASDTITLRLGRAPRRG